MAALVLAVADLVLRDERLFALAVPAGVLAEVDVAGILLLDALDQLVHPDPMAPFGGADEVVVADVELLPEIVMVGDHAVCQLDGQDPFLRRRTLDLLAVLIRACQKPDVIPHAAPVARCHVRDHVLVHVSDVRIVVDVVDGRGDVELLRHEGGGLYCGRRAECRMHPFRSSLFSPRCCA